MHMLRVSLNEETGRLVLRPTNRASRTALIGQPDGRDEVLLDPHMIESVRNAPPRLGGILNGEVTVQTKGTSERQQGWTYRLHYRAKDAADVGELVHALRVAGYPVRA